MENYSTFVNRYGMDFFNYLFDKSLFFKKIITKRAQKSMYKKRLSTADYKF